MVTTRVLDTYGTNDDTIKRENCKNDTKGAQISTQTHGPSYEKTVVLFPFICQVYLKTVFLINLEPNQEEDLNL